MSYLEFNTETGALAERQKAELLTDSKGFIDINAMEKKAADEVAEQSKASMKEINELCDKSVQQQAELSACFEKVNEIAKQQEAEKKRIMLETVKMEAEKKAKEELTKESNLGIFSDSEDSFKSMLKDL